MTAAELDALIQGADRSRVEAAWTKAVQHYSAMYEKAREQGYSEHLSCRFASLKADAVFLEEVHQFSKH